MLTSIRIGPGKANGSYRDHMPTPSGTPTPMHDETTTPIDDKPESTRKLVSG